MGGIIHEMKISRQVRIYQRYIYKIQICYIYQYNVIRMISCNNIIYDIVKNSYLCGEYINKISFIVLYHYKVIIKI